MIVSAAKDQKIKYPSNCINAIRAVLENNTYSDIEEIELPPVLNLNTFSLFEKLDIAVIDINEDTTVNSIVGYMHGRFIPTIRMYYGFEKMNPAILKMFSNFLYGGVQVGYNEDLILWDNIKTLKSELNIRLKIIKAPVKRINTTDEATEYFRSAALRKEAVFLSYSGKDIDKASKIRSSLRKHFQKVFDYKDGE